MTFEEEILENIKTEINELDPAIKEILKKGMIEGEKKEDGSGIDKIQLDAAKAASVILQEYVAHIIGRPVSRTELSGKEGKPLSVNINFVLEEEKQETQNGDTQQDSQNT